jgi:hypothetical protein
MKSLLPPGRGLFYFGTIQAAPKAQGYKAMGLIEDMHRERTDAKM